MNRWMQVVSRADSAVLIAWVLLLLMGLAALYSCTVDFQSVDQVVPSTVDRSVFLGQLVWVALGVLAAIACAVVPFRHYDTLAYVIYAASIVLLLMVLVFGKEIGGGRRWLSIAGLSVQPSEFAKLALMIALARFLATHRERSPLLLVSGAAALVLPVFVLVLRQPDLGTAIVFPALAVPMLFWAGVRLGFLLALASPAISALVMFFSYRVLASSAVWPWVAYILIVLGLLYFLRLYLLPSMLLAVSNILTGLSIPLVFDRLQPYQQQRILSFFDASDANRLNYGYQTFQSKVAIGSGGILGKGFLAGTQKGLAFLPERHTDFIFSVVGEEFGLWGTWIVLALFYVLLWRCFRSAVVVRRPFGSLLLIGVASYFAFQVLVNVSITVGLLPVTGLPLPFFSKGGSSMLASCLMIGLYFNVSSRWSEV